MRMIKNIIFDLGGILLNIDFNIATKNFKKLGVNAFDQFFRQDHASELFSNLETGKISPIQFYHSFLSETGITITYEELTEAWNSLLLDFPLDRIELLEELRKDYNLYLFSNTNQIHYDAFTASFKALTGKNFNDYFKKAYYSHEIGLRKPHTQAFEFILKEQHLIPSETLFIDDTFPNVQAAKLLGLKTIHINGSMTILDKNVLKIIRGE